MISAVVPAFNEEESIKQFYAVLSANLLKLGQDYEIVFVDDGSTDSTLDILKKLAARDRKIRVFSFRKNRGKAEALTIGFQMAKGDYIVTLDADLQDRPEEIGKLLEKAKEGFDLVSGWRKDRKDALKTRLSSKLFNFMMSAFWGVHLHDYNCGLKLYTKEAAQSLNLYGGLHRFVPLLVAEKGFEVTEIPVVHEKRQFGKSKYGFSKIFRDVPDMFTVLFLSRYAKRPLHFFGFVGGIISATGFLILVYLAILHFMGQRIGDRPLLIFGMLMLLAGLQLLFTGLLADLILHISQKDGQGINLEDGFKYKTE
jgi:glycosyltransferase involved in cell wall biosynthesis